jgi:hypothetical protein
MSLCSFFLQIYLYGGYFKEVSSDKEKGTVHADMWSLDPRTWEWNKVNTDTQSLLFVDFYLTMLLHPGIHGQYLELCSKTYKPPFTSSTLC